MKRRPMPIFPQPGLAALALHRDERHGYHLHVDPRTVVVRGTAYIDEHGDPKVTGWTIDGRLANDTP